MRNELRDREPAVSPAQPPVQDDVVSVGEAQASIDAMEKGLPWMAGGYPGAIGVSESRALRRAQRDEWSVDIQGRAAETAQNLSRPHDSASKLPEPEAKRFKVSLRNCSPPTAPDPPNDESHRSAGLPECRFINERFQDTRPDGPDPDLRQAAKVRERC